MNLSGIIVGLSSFVIIGIFHPVVIKCEYYFSARIWPLFLVMGVACVMASFMIGNDVLSGIVGVLGFCFLWSIHELRQQEKRVARGWFPKNPKRTDT
ncbi:MAG: DUF4491 family protein [Synergistaceae bacterium]|nr:DUF4491 family protein [Synergistaceae bacterium]